VSPLEFFKKNHPTIERILKKRLAEESGSDGEGRYSSFANLRDLHRGISVRDLRAKNKFTSASYDEMKRYLKEASLENTTDGKALLQQIAETEKVLSGLDRWLAVDPSSSDYENQLNESAQELKKSLGIKRDDSYSLRERVKFLMAQPFAKFQQMVGEGRKIDSENIFSNPFKPKSRALSNHDRFMVLRDVYNSVSDPRVELKDINLVNDTRQLFESNNSTLRKNFLDGIKGLRERMASSPDPEVSRKMLIQLCGLAYSLPSNGSTHASDDCTGLMPKEMQSFIGSGGAKEVPNCTYHRYINERIRTDYFETGRMPSLPSDSNPDGSRK